MARQYIALLLLGVLFQFASCQDEATRFLLPGNLQPIHYNLTLYPHIERFQGLNPGRFQYEGTIIITVEAVNENVSEVVINRHVEVELVEVSIVGLSTDGAERTVEIGSFDSRANKQTLLVNPPLIEGNQYEITIDYTGINNNALTGFYRSNYNAGGRTRWLVVTDLEPTGARRAFPCLDEPALKATWEATVVYNQILYDDGYIAHFNTEISSEEVRDGQHITRFETTARPISTYLVCIILADFLSSPEPTYFNSSYNGENGTKPFWTIGQSKFYSPRQDLTSQVAGPAALNFVTQKTGVGFGLLKVEQAGIPDFAAGAMENWGLVTYRENLVFWNEQSGSTGAQEGVVTVTAHELGHQWFGDLVTLHWWKDLWLNEGFATFFEFHTSDQIREPTLDTSSWDLIGQFVEGTLEGGALFVDSFSDEVPLTSDVYDPNDISSRFDSISYDKGGSILRMWMHILGEDLFYSGLSVYLKQQQEKVGTPEILLSSWDKAIAALPASQRPDLPLAVAQLFAGWHLQSGYPVVTVARRNGVLTLTQERFLYDDTLDTKYDVPLSYSTDLENNFNNTSPVGFLLASDDSTTLQLKNAQAEWVIVNNQQTGYYRVNYDDDNWDLLIDTINGPNRNQIHPYNRAQIIDDLSALSAVTLKNYVPVAKLLKALISLRNEPSARVWKTGLRIIQRLYYLLENSEGFNLFKLYAQWLVEPAFERLSLNVKAADSHNDKILRMNLGRFACQIDLPSCKKQALEIFSTGSMHPDVRGIVFCEGVKAGDVALWDKLLEEALATDGPERDDILAGLSCTQDEDLFDRLQSMTVTMDRISEIDVQSIQRWAGSQNNERAEKVLRSMALRPESLDPAKRQIVREVAFHLGSEQIIEDIQSLGPVPSRAIRFNSLWKKSKLPAVVEWLKFSMKL